MVIYPISDKEVVENFLLFLFLMSKRIRSDKVFSPSTIRLLTNLRDHFSTFCYSLLTVLFPIPQLHPFCLDSSIAYIIGNQPRLLLPLLFTIIYIIGNQLVSLSCFHCLRMAQHYARGMIKIKVKGMGIEGMNNL
ncbi:hypothetical protein RIR_jg11572.t1 [Rhizophagus irregularis DAOM 181602=DAOM 197198]|uniref:Uncharacterized protein n=1 Tax=Rhizophagus irregularis (strain DAOM 181602 / DAOM 197198 / MUCL 43194) TaxID=747089 RepID=U9TLC7_RHIID|nr:hypothetical protein RIR_jg11572.t1 [Rhizophagus irregularis DAOM 181602=DAOM 197198]